MEAKAETTKDINKQANPVPYAEVSSKNRQHAVDALDACKKCQEITQVEADNLGCQIKYEANSDSTETIEDAKYLLNPYDRWKKSYSTVVDKKVILKLVMLIKNGHLTIVMDIYGMDETCLLLLLDILLGISLLLGTMVVVV